MPQQKKYLLKAQGWCLDMTANKLSSEQVAKVKEYCDEEGEDYDEIGGNLEDVLEDYHCDSGNLWETGVAPIPGTCEFILEDDNGTVIFGPVKVGDGQGDIKTAVSPEPSFVVENKDPAQDTLIYVEQSKGTVAVWSLESTEVPTVADFEAQVVKVDVDDFLEYVDNVLFKGAPLERIGEAEDFSGKSAMSKLL